MVQTPLILSAYRILDRVTPLQTDCGELCGKACCQSRDDLTQSSGMYLFPGETAILSKAAYLSLQPVAIPTAYGTYRSVLAICDGFCPRRLRPLACRIFPLTPYVDMSGDWTLHLDLRGRNLCPLVMEMSPDDLEPDFIESVRTVTRLLTADPENRYFLTLLSRIQDETSALFTRFGIQSPS